ncbi:MAG: aspartate ammonia-lyase [Omnitrophica bacterium RIFCSPHIGHO2_02_FULL_51_18]|nr:MAG: aspartate ammonia-lyase [Omnitrophica bacterium RIFCSPHIGHO2_02_FULL_51_18]
MANVRIEKDSLGERKIPDEVYYGIQTDRAIENFPISGLRAHPRFIDAYVTVKKAAAIANAKSGVLSKNLSDALVSACDEILSGKLRDQFPVDVFQMGAGTAYNMNVNEVISNRANEILGGRKGDNKPVHPNDHANMGQSTNDTFPSTMRIALLLILRENLYEPLEALEKEFLKKGREFDGVLKSARTHLQDAVPIRLGQEFKAYGEAIKKSRIFVQRAAESLCELGIGGSAAGTGLNTAPGYREEIIKELNRLTGLKLVPAEDMRESMQSQRPMAEVSAALRNLSLELIRIVNDLRLLSSGPTTGFAEIDLPATAPGSSIMPGKVNPSILEMVNMTAFHVVGSDTTVAMAVQAGQLELNVMMPVMAYELNFSATILGNTLKILREKCVQGITANAERCRHYAQSSMGLATALNTFIGYAQAAEVAKEALKSHKTIIQVIREKKMLSEAEIQKIMDPVRMTEPGIPKK